MSSRVAALPPGQEQGDDLPPPGGNRASGSGARHVVGQNRGSGLRDGFPGVCLP